LRCDEEVGKWNEEHGWGKKGTNYWRNPAGLPAHKKARRQEFGMNDMTTLVPKAIIET
jgi:hypothetical protein